MRFEGIVDGHGDQRADFSHGLRCGVVDTHHKAFLGQIGEADHQLRSTELATLTQHPTAAYTGHIIEHQQRTLQAGEIDRLFVDQGRQHVLN